MLVSKAAEEVEDIVLLEETKPTSGSNPPPPPPLPSSGVPPPPPLMAPSVGSALGRPCAVQSKVKLRPFFWNKVPAQLVIQGLEIFSLNSRFVVNCRERRFDAVDYFITSFSQFLIEQPRKET